VLYTVFVELSFAAKLLTQSCHVSETVVEMSIYPWKHVDIIYLLSVPSKIRLVFGTVFVAELSYSQHFLISDYFQNFTVHHSVISRSLSPPTSLPLFAVRKTASSTEGSCEYIE
jgi:hypothetical protein